MRTTLRSAAFLGTTSLLIVGCVTQVPESQSVVEGVTFRDASQLTVTIADILGASLQPSQTVLAVRTVRDEDQMHIGRLLEDSLRERGFALSPGGMDYPQSHLVRYQIAPVGGYVQLALNVDEASATCLYGHDVEGVLVSVGTCALRLTPGLALAIPANARLTHQVLAQSSGPLNILPPAAGVADASRPPSPPVAVAPAKAPIAPRVTGPSPSTSTPNGPSSAPLPRITQTWTLVEGQPIRDQMIAWGDRAGWRVIWPAEINWAVPATTSFTGPFHGEKDGEKDGESGVVSQVVRTVASQGKPLRVEFYVTNHVVLVTSLGAQQ